jgi:hypothetical protein
MLGKSIESDSSESRREVRNLDSRTNQPNAGAESNISIRGAMGLLYGISLDSGQCKTLDLIVQPLAINGCAVAIKPADG